MKKTCVVINVSKALVLVGYKQHGQLVSNQRYVDDRLCKNACIRVYFSLCKSLFLCLFLLVFTSGSPQTQLWSTYLHLLSAGIAGEYYCTVM